MPKPKIRRGYSDTEQGQLHWRRNSIERIEIVLLHWAPASSRMYEPVLISLAEFNVGAVAFDLPGFGQSLRPPAPWGPAEISACLATGLRDLTEEAVAIAGGHFAANIAIEWALSKPHLVSRLVLDGVYAPTPEEAAVLFAPYAGLTPRPRFGTSHETFLWHATSAFLHEWNPRFELTPETMPVIYDAMADYLQMGYQAILNWLEPGNEPLFPYDAIERVAHVARPILALTAQFDALRPTHARVLKAQPRALKHEFSGVHPLMEPSRAPEYAVVLTNFVRGIAPTTSI